MYCLASNASYLSSCWVISLNWDIAEFSCESWLADALPWVFTESVHTARVGLTLITSGASVAGTAPTFIWLRTETVPLIAALNNGIGDTTDTYTLI